jgi:PAS domain S-box-containing protein
VRNRRGLAIPSLVLMVIAVAIGGIAIGALYVRSATVVGGVALALTVVGALMFFAAGKPVVRRIREGEHRFRELFENMRSAAAVYRATNEGDDFVLIDLNRGAERMEGVARREVLGRLLSDVFPAIRHGRLFEVLRRVWRTGQPELANRLRRACARKRPG